MLFKVNLFFSNRCPYFYCLSFCIWITILKHKECSISDPFNVVLNVLIVESHNFNNTLSSNCLDFFLLMLKTSVNRIHDQLTISISKVILSIFHSSVETSDRDFN